MICLAVILTFELQCWVRASISHIKGSLRSKIRPFWGKTVTCPAP